MPADLTQSEAIARAALIDVQSYDVFLDVSAGPNLARSRTEIRFGCRNPGAATFADLTAPTIRQIICNGENLDPAVAVSAGRIALAGLAATNTLVVEAEFPYSGDGNGIAHFTDPADGAGYVFANFFPTYAPRAFCCFDQPDLRADLTLTVSAPAGWDCVANGTVISRPASGAAGLWRFATVPAMKPYELTLCAGPYVTALLPERGPDSVSLTVRSRRSLAAAGGAGLARVAELVSTVIDFYARFLGVPCPQEKLDVTFPPGLAFPAMQLPGATFVSETLLDRVAREQDEFVTVVLSHEVAHLWFGCLVEGRWWDDFWIAESVATYLSYTACDQALGLDSPWAVFTMRDQAAAYRADSVPSAEPVSAPVASAADAMSRPPAITYNKGASVIRQLAALIGEDALRAGMRDYLSTYGGAATDLAELVGCWSQASGRDLTGWSRQWLQQPGVNTLRPELVLEAGGAVESFAVTQEPPWWAAGPLRAHRIGIGIYDLDPAGRGGLVRRQLVTAEIDGARTLIPELAGAEEPAAVVLNDGNQTFARIRFDDRSLPALLAAGLRLGDPVTEAVCWTAVWDMTMTAELRAAAFVRLVAGRIPDGEPIAGLPELLAHAVSAATLYSLPGGRPGLRQQLAAAALAGAAAAKPGSSTQHAFAVGFAAAADSQQQLATLRTWLSTSPAPGVRLDLELHAAILRNLAARSLATDQDLDAYAAADPVSGDLVRASCLAARPDSAAKEQAWAAALAQDQSPQLARAYAQGFWVPGQDEALAPFADRYFTAGLAALRTGKLRTALRLARLLFPATLADTSVLDRADAAIAAAEPDDPFRPVLIEQRTLLARVIAARHAS